MWSVQNPSIAFIFFEQEADAKAVVEAARASPVSYLEPNGHLNQLKMQPDRALDNRRHALAIGKVRTRLEGVVKNAKIISNGHRGKVIAERTVAGVRTLIPICSISKVASNGAVSHHMIPEADSKLGVNLQVLEAAVAGGIEDAKIRPLR